MSNSSHSPSRRRWLASGSASVAAAGLAGVAWGNSARAAAPEAASAATSPPPAAPTSSAKPLPANLAWKDGASLIVHSNSTIETRREALGSSVITPTQRLYLRNNLPMPDPSIVADPDAWELYVQGVQKPNKFTLAQLKTMGLETVAMVLQCSGNGRGFFPNQPSGTPWKVGAAGCVVWSGVPVRTVVEALGGLDAQAKFMTGTGGEKLPAGVDPKQVMVERSVPLAAMQDALLAWELNGAPIPLAHGGPLRLIVPGYTGVNNIKYIRELSFSAQESDARIMSHGYRITPPNGKPDASQPSVQEMSVKSWINTPSAQSGALRAGTVQIQGVAFGGVHAVKQVEVSVDGGKNWQMAKFIGPDLGRYAWRVFVLEARLGAGEHTLVSRATDARGTVQPQTREENLSGFNNTSWQDHAVVVQVS